MTLKLDAKEVKQEDVYQKSMILEPTAPTEDIDEKMESNISLTSSVENVNSNKCSDTEIGSVSNTLESSITSECYIFI